jgi:hypothetical protein
MKVFLEPQADAKMDSATVQMVAYLLKHTAHRYMDMNGKDALEFAANALLKADRECMS